jgi:hypothetical protein
MNWYEYNLSVQPMRQFILLNGNIVWDMSGLGWINVGSL